MRRSIPLVAAALGVTQTAEVLNIVERVRDQGHGVLLVSHSMTDVQAVADRIVVLRRGRLNGVFDASRTGYEDIIAAIKEKDFGIPLQFVNYR